MLRATEFSLGLPKALTSSSYHLQIESPDGTFIESRQLEDEPSSESASASASRPRSRSETGVPIAPVLLPPKGAPSAWYADVSGKHYAQKVHLYTRDYYERGSRNPTFSFRLVEDLPGAMGRSFAAAFASAVVIWIVGAIGVAGTAHSAVSTGQPSPGLNPLAFVVAIPSFLASWVAFASPRRSPYVSLATRLTLLFAAVLGLASMVLYLGQMGGFIPVWGPYTPPGAPAPLNILFITDPAWMLLFFLSLVNVVSVGSIMMVRHARHIGLFGGRQDED